MKSSSPPGRYSIQNGGLQLEHDNNEDTLALVTINEPCAIEITADYNPTETTDKGGLILFK
ncbi:hypothetical protein, partial [Pseudomonas sp. GP01-A3]|uniref:hypothetical protein n=1 Tax=Pseudomonas sp. GP01-A3 TaxID=2070568 RepID=UPI001C4423B6